jgi:hypothetical protein
MKGGGCATFETDAPDSLVSVIIRRFSSLDQNRDAGDPLDPLDDGAPAQGCASEVAVML